ncbi:MAG: bifunctional 2-polyprenyl-6-hydroxyphenol methylase/3-demethylubiquinol 3-O-methyltransferase UbiG [Alphaproteobacteria bacterium]|nr:bifunctional 2-polyprenyl-6-hydroxyphenol methylase/3-demethylubiquinol 3-O-methyltransferase UbiG [Alphaproteobacteria bacterium]MBV9551287.1 bifunctional 2-polyprenyl-6-hydroxyphenol methylase/3-demethylubiquinol 3-O-methyltransferase UbiG [Alphaproteobacteria bacterium]
MTASQTTVDPTEVKRFAAHAAGWWDPSGSFAPLHRLNPARLHFIRRQFDSHFGRDSRSLTPYRGLTLCDVGCGGGLIAEPMARLGFRVTAIDADETALAVAHAHAAAGGITIDYRGETAESLVAAGERFDAVLALEIVEHIADLQAFLDACGALLKPGGAFIGATLNRTPQAYALAVVGAEYVLGWLPRGTHDWRRFVRPSEFVLGLRRAGLTTRRMTGLRYRPVRSDWVCTDDLAINYMLMATKP